ncbi:hypothetical protein AAY80_169 [Stenotrophomonas phage vB_SmaS-DLP_6]|nr:hypothetical protein AAY80_169 [Stenotrophomonas phage vB_SmaS-DLP_6]
MLIVSKFHDYYDSAAGFGVDKALVYKRVSEVGGFLRLPRLRGAGPTEERHRLKDGTLVYIKAEIVPLVFCGDVFYRHVADVNLSFAPAAPSMTRRWTHHDKKSLYSAIYKEYGLSEKTDDRPRWMGSRWEMKDDSITFEEALPNQDLVGLSIREGTPVWSLRTLKHNEKDPYARGIEIGPRDITYVIERDPVLKDLGFFQVKDPYQAFQDISMFLGGVMGVGDRPMVQLSDKEVHQKHGFDKMSFRKAPETTK